jgi:hypothetical protein
MSIYLKPAIVLTVFFGVTGLAADKPAPPAAGRVPVFNLSAAPTKAAPSRFSDGELAYVQSWIRQKAPECPVEAAGQVAEKFLEELQQRSPENLAQLLSPGFPSAAFESTLLRHVGAKLGGASQAAQRDEIARRRVLALLAQDDRGTTATPAEAAGLLEKIRDASPAQHRRLLEGRLEDDEFRLLLKKTRQAGMAQKEPAPDKPKVLAAADIVSEFSRHNQAGSAVQRLQAYAAEGRLTTPAGEQQELFLFRMRPDRFRLVMRSGGITRYILASDGGSFWQQSPGRPPQEIPPQSMGPRLYLAEFIDPLLAAEGYRFERLPDGASGNKKFHRLSVHRTDGSNYVACIDTETFREIARENEDGSGARYSDFRDVAGVTFAFREEVSDKEGRKGVLVLTRVTANPGLIQALFVPDAKQAPDYFEIEQALAGAARASSQPKG